MERRCESIKDLLIVVGLMAMIVAVVLNSLIPGLVVAAALVGFGVAQLLRRGQSHGRRNQRLRAR